MKRLSLSSSDLSIYTTWFSQRWLLNRAGKFRRASTWLPQPTIVYEDNHLLVVNKPAGWHSVPNPDSPVGQSQSQKCLLSELKRRSLGGGSQKNFLLPLHRIDQPCTGLILFGKTRKAASRITKQWKQKRVLKEYLCVILTQNLSFLRETSLWTESKELDGEAVALTPTTSQDQSHVTAATLMGWSLPRASKNDRSVSIRPYYANQVETQKPGDARLVTINWELLKTSAKVAEVSLLKVSSIDGSRHVIRAMLGLVGNCPICGDMRYGARLTTANSVSALPDRSVALHAHRVSFDPETLKLGSLQQFDFHAPLPPLWSDFFGFNDDDEILARV